MGFGGVWVCAKLGLYLARDGSMIWTILAFLGVLGTKFITAMRLKGLKAKLEAIQPRIDEVRSQLREVEEEYETLKLSVEDRESRLTHLQDAVRNLEDSLKRPADVDFQEAEDRGRATSELAHPAVETEP